MPDTTTVREPRYKLHGLALIVAASLLVTLSLLAFNRTFQSTVPISVRISHAGLQLLPGSDVKVRGIIVGEVASITSDGNGAVLKLQLQPSKAHEIPQNVSVRLIPKTLFGEKYVDLVLPPHPSTHHLVAGAVIPEDRSTPALEIDQALGDLLPVLRAVKPAALNDMLSSLAQALEGRGEQIGQMLVQMRDYFDEFTPHLPTLKADWAKLASVGTTYGNAAPALLRMLRNLTVVSQTVTAQRVQLSAFLAEMTDASDATRGLFQNSGNDLVQVNQLSKGVLQLMAKYSPEYPCLIKGIVDVIPHIKVAVPKTGKFTHEPHVMLELVPPYHSYKNPIDLPEFHDTRGPNCYGLPNPPKSLPRVHYKDGTEDDPSFQHQPGDGGGSTLPTAQVSGAATLLWEPLVSGLVRPGA